MISEGTDIPRLQVCCHLTSVKTELYFRQILGRILRMTNKSIRSAWLYTFAEPNLKEYAHRLQEEIPKSSIVTKYNIDLLSSNANNFDKKGNVEHCNQTRNDFELSAEISQFEAEEELSELNGKSNTLDIVGRYREQVIATY